MEIVIRINRVGKHIAEKYAAKYYNAIGLGIDFTARDIQQEAKKKGLPWEKAKAFDGSAVLGEFMGIEEIDDLNNLNFSLLVNNKPVQEGNTSNMIFNVNKIIAYVSQFMTLKIGDLIFTGTPEGVGPVNQHDVLEGFIEEKKMFQLKVK